MRADAAERLTEELKWYAIDTGKRNRLASIIHDKFNIPTGETMDYIVGRRDLRQSSDDVIFVFCYGVDEIDGGNRVRDYFNRKETKLLLSYRREDSGVSFPLKFRCFQVVANSQWIGVTDANFLTDLFRAQIINYNPNAQRAMKQSIFEGNAFYKIAINQKAVNSIAEAMIEGRFIPNTITINIPQDAEWSYNSTDCILTIKKETRLDILDGYHRLLAMELARTKDATFNCRMELRITFFDDEIARHFIYQEDQKTKMRKIDSDAMSGDVWNTVADRVATKYPFMGIVGRNNGVINFGEMASIIHYYWFPERVGVADGNRMIPTVTNEIVEKGQVIFESAPAVFKTNHMTFMRLMALMYCIRKYNTDEIAAHIQNYLENEGAMDARKFRAKKPRKGLDSYLSEYM